MRIEILSTGNEVVSGDTVDTNAARISQKLMSLGLETQRHQAVPDDRAMLDSVLREISARADVCICSGGLGPTPDDLTAEVVAKVLGVDLELNAEAEARMQARFQKASLRYSSNNQKSAWLPRGSRVIQNQVGTAPSFALTIGSCAFWFLPGVPKEFDFFVETDVIPQLKDRQRLERSSVTRVHQFKTLGWSESHLSEALEDFVKLYTDVELGFRVHLPEVWVKLTARAETEEKALERLTAPSQEVRKRIGNSIFGEQDQELPLQVHELMIQGTRTLAVAESCTGGLLSSLLTAIPGSSHYFLGGAVTYSNSLKMGMLGVPSELLEKFGAVSRECAEAMVTGVAQVTDAQWSIALTGIAGPSGGTDLKPVGLVYCGMKDARTQKVWVDEWRLRGDRERIQKTAAFMALQMLRLRILELEK